jgi:hypothetical protein
MAATPASGVHRQADATTPLLDVSAVAEKKRKERERERERGRKGKEENLPFVLCSILSALGRWGRIPLR